MHEIINNFSKFLLDNEYSEKTAEVYTYSVKLFSEFLQTRGKDFNCDVMDIEDFRNSLTPGTNTKNLYLKALRKFYSYLAYIGKDYIKPERILLYRTFSKESDYVTKEEMLDLMDKIKGFDLNVIRNKLIIKLLRETGIRVSELCSLKRTDLKYDGSDYYFQFIGKGRKERITYISGKLYSDIKSFRDLLEDNNINSDYIVSTLARNSKGKMLTRITVEKVIRDISYKGRKITPHSFRHGMATHALQQGCNIADLQKLLGHSNIRTTSTYLHSNSNRIKKLQELCW